MLGRAELQSHDTQWALSSACGGLLSGAACTKHRVSPSSHTAVWSQSLCIPQQETGELANHGRKSYWMYQYGSVSG